ncbi:unnamed protein product [Pleuronectes platessa]|uniref:Uncharacterized protein n=1 Tax=Pleuronectes platessa TaxID=8262 RepID=A0A9N7UCZ9_PLEPL|nr:unnamed protein product [Pleuronectes platessa]
MWDSQAQVYYRGVSQVKEQPATIATAPFACNRPPFEDTRSVTSSRCTCEPPEARLRRHVKLNTVAMWLGDTNNACCLCLLACGAAASGLAVPDTDEVQGWRPAP